MKKLKYIFTINRGLIISRFEHFHINCRNCNSNEYFIAQQWNNEEKNFCVEISEKFIARKGDIVIKTNYPFKVKHISTEEKLVISANHIIIKSSLVINLINTNKLSLFLEKELIQPFLRRIDSNQNKFLITLNKQIIENFKISLVLFRNKNMIDKFEDENENMKIDNLLNSKLFSIKDLYTQKIIDQKQFDELKNEIIGKLFK